MTESDDYYILKIDRSKYFPKGRKRRFTITNNQTGRSYNITADPWTTLDLAWASQKCWFMPGSVVTITDDKHNTKTFIKEN